MEVSFSPGSILRIFRRESFFFQMDPEGIDISNVKYYPSPTVNRTATLQVDDRELGLWNAQGTERRFWPSIEHFHAQYIAIELDGSLHMSDRQGDRRKLFNGRLHNGSSLQLSDFVELVFYLTVFLSLNPEHESRIGGTRSENA
jgi:hypothetical protein